MTVRAVAVTGLGTVCAIGDSPDAVFDAALAGRSGVLPAPGLDVGAGAPLVAAAHFDERALVTPLRNVAVDRATALALTAARQACTDAGGRDVVEGGRTGVYWGTGMGGVTTLEASYRAIFGDGSWRVKPGTVVTVMLNAPASCIAIDQHATGPALTYSVACASSAIAIGEAMLAIRAGRIDCAIVGGSDSLLTAPVLSAWSALRALATRDARDPARSCKPFAATRSGFVLGEAAAALVLESDERARARGARRYALAAGYGTSCDASHLADPLSGGQARAIAAALDDAGLAPQAVGYVNAHGTATRAGDRAETLSLRAALGEHAERVPVSSTKAVHGHTMGAAGALEFLIAVLAIHHGAVPPTAHLDDPDPELGLDFVAEGPRRGVDLVASMSNSFAFGGSNAVLVARRAAP